MNIMNMILRQVMRRFINMGISKGMDMGGRAMRSRSAQQRRIDPVEDGGWDDDVPVQRPPQRNRNKQKNKNRNRNRQNH